MSKTNRTLINQLKKIRSDLASLDPSNPETLIEIGASLEQFSAAVPEDYPALSRLVLLCLGGLQAIYEKTAVDLPGLCELIPAATIAIEQFLSSPENKVSQVVVDETTRKLERAISSTESVDEVVLDEVVEAPDSEVPADSAMSLDDIAAMLVPLEPNDIADLKRVRDGLRGLSNVGGYVAETSRIVDEAADELDELIEGKSEDPDAVLSRVGKLVEAAAQAVEYESATPVEGERERVTASSKSDKTPEEVSEAPVNVPKREGEMVAVQAPSPSAEVDVLPIGADPNLIADFVVESREYLEHAEAALLTLETDPEDVEAINVVFRAFHTIKGTSAFIGLNWISDLAHRAESLLSRVRDKEIRCTGGYADLALRSADTLNDLLQGTQDALGGQPLLKPSGYDSLMALLADPEAGGISGEADSLEAPRIGDILVAEGKADREEVDVAAAVQGDEKIGVALLKSNAATLPDVAHALRMQQRMTGNKPAADASVRVRTDRLDRLIDMVGELVIAQAMVAQDQTVNGHHDLSRKVSHSSKIVRELQDLSMAMRMVPLKPTFQKMARVVRDLAHRSGKLVEFGTEGDDTEIDRHMVDIIADPLVHMVRNAVDHGLESPEEREKNGKSRTGSLRLLAYHIGSDVAVELRDDGRGLNREKILQKALAKGLIESEKLDDDEVYQLIFAPGFSTADQVTEVSGRGVGLDVVKRNIEALRGRIEITSQPGAGCSFRLRLPLTLAITDGMLVKVGHERYIIPTINIQLSFQPSADMISTVTGRGEMVLLRGELMPVFHLHHLFGVEGAVEDVTKALLVVVADGGRRCALLVDELLGQQQVVAKALGSRIGKLHGVSGGAILGDGRVGLILDPTEIIGLARSSAGREGQQRQVSQNSPPFLDRRDCLIPRTDNSEDRVEAIAH